jgi:hypothetical protein
MAVVAVGAAIAVVAVATAAAVVAVGTGTVAVGSPPQAAMSMGRARVKATILVRFRFIKSSSFGYLRHSL